MMRFGHFGGTGPGDGIGFLFFILMIIFFGTLLWLLLSASHRRDAHSHAPFSGHGHGPYPQHHDGHNSEARAILDRRFASGEIDEEEYTRRRKLLEGDS